MVNLEFSYLEDSPLQTGALISMETRIILLYKRSGKNSTLNRESSLPFLE